MTTQTGWLFDDLTNPFALDASDESDGWYTPAPLIAAAREVLGAIDLDPATCEAAQSVVQATCYHTRHDNGLMQPWRGRVWLNPPYSAPTQWIDKLLAHYTDGEVTAALVITNAYTETGWWQRLAARGVMLFFAGRQQFWHPNKETGNNRMGQTLCYLGPDADRFRAVFGPWGVIR